MKVNVLQVEQATFRNKWSWWSNWVDVSIFDHGGDGYLLQMKISRRNAKKFKAIPFKSFPGLAHPCTDRVGDLTQSQRSINHGLNA